MRRWMGLATVLLLHFVLALKLSSAQSSRTNPDPRSATDLQTRANAALSASDFALARELYERILAGGSPSPATISNAGLAEEQTGNLVRAVFLYRQALRQAELPKTRALLASDLCVLGDLESAAVELDKIKLDSEDLRTAQLLAPCYLLAGIPMESAAVYELLLSKRAEPFDRTLAGYAMAMFRVSQQYVQMLTQTDKRAEYAAALNRLRLNEPAGAQTDLTQALKQALYLRVDMSVDEFRSAISSHETNAAALFVVAVIFGERGIAALNLLDADTPDSPALTEIHAEIASDMGQARESIRLYKTLEAGTPANAQIHFHLGVLYLEIHQPEEALDEFNNVLLSHPGDLRCMKGKSEALLALGRVDEEELLLRPLLDKDAWQDWVLEDAATLDERREQLESAISHLVQLETQSPEIASVHYRLSRLYRATRKPEESKAELALFLKIRNRKSGNPVDNREEGPRN